MNKNNRQHAGFTMAEVLVTVGILAVLLAVAIPNVISARKNLNMTELDATARIILIAAQDNLTGMQGAATLTKLGAAPPSGLTGESADVRYLTAGDALMETLLPFGAVDPTVAANHYLIRFNTEYGTVLEVFYAEEELPAAADLFAMAGSGDAARAARRNAGVGYYAGGDVTVDTPERLPTPAVAVDNGEELTVTVTIPAAPETLTHAKPYLNIRPANGSVAAVSLPLTLTDMVRGTVTVTLDSLAGGKQFKDLFRGLTPGCDLMISAVLTPIPPTGTGDKVYLGSASAEAQVNSLFAARETRGGADTVLIANGRHLQNLSTAFSGVESGITAAVQTAAVTWDGAFSLRPIENAALASYDGASLPITGAVIAGSGDVGLFGSLSAVAPNYIELNNITLVNAKISGGSRSQGMLVGSGSRLRVENCGVYVSVLKNAGGGSYAYDYAEYTKYGMDSTAQYTGGLIGYAAYCTIADSFAALPSIDVNAGLSGTAAGGLVGRAEACYISGSYGSADQLEGSAEHNGMFIGWADANTTISHCYAVGNMRALALATSYLSGFLYGGAEVHDSYCAVTYLDYFGVDRNVDRFAFTSGGTAEGCAYLDTGSNTKKGDGASSLSYDALKSWGSIRPGWGTPGAKASYPYNSELEGRAYPFSTPRKQGVTAAHRGSWPLSAVTLALAYYEVYADGSQGFFAPAMKTSDAANTVKTVNTLKSGVIAVSDGYALLARAKLTTQPRITYQKTAGQRDSAPCTLSGEAPVTLDTGSYYVYLLPNEALQTAYADGAAVWQKLYCGGVAYWYEPHFAAAVAVYEEGKTPEVPKALQVRTARQLYNLGLFPALWNQVFVQPLEIDGGTYQWAASGLGDGVPVLTPIGDAGRPFTGGYNGGGNAIRGVTLGASGPLCGLFGSVGSTGKILNTVLSPEGITVPMAVGGLVGPLAGENGGTIEQCEVTLPASLNLGGASFGGLVGRNTGSIARSKVLGGAAGSAVNGAGLLAGFAAESSGPMTDCSVRPASGLAYEGLSLSATGRGSRAAGFAGTLTGGTVSTCWAAAKVEAVGADTRAAGFALSAGAGAAVSGCYANSKTGAEGTAAGFILDIAGRVDYCYALLRVEAGGAASGFADSVTGRVSASYAAAEAKGGTASYGFARSAGSGALTNCHYLSGSYRGAQTGTAVAYAKLTAALCFGSDRAWTDGNKGKSHPFNTGLGDTYPFPRLTALEHYGDWPEESADAVGLVYYEKYSNGSYGFYGLDASEAHANALKGNDYTIVATGYGFLLPDGETPPLISYNNNDPLPLSKLYRSPVSTVGGKTLYAFSDEAVAYLNNGYNWVTLQTAVRLPNGYRYENYRCVNFGFAAAITAAGKSHTMGTTEVPLQVRTQEQISHVGIDTTLLYIRQTHDIDITGAWTPIRGKDGGTRIIDGYGNKITGLTQPLFDSIQQNSTLTNLWITAAKVKVTGAAASGILMNAALSGITVTNCRVTDSSIQGQKVAGMFGSVEYAPKKISNCWVENVTVTSDVAGGVAAGFAVSVSGKGEFSNCHVSPSPTDGGYGKVLIQATQHNSLAAGLIGAVADTPITSSYAVGTVSAPLGRAAGFVGMQQNGRISTSYANCVTSGSVAAGFLLSPNNSSVTDCYALLSVSGKDEAYGFCGTPVNNMPVSGCYSAATVTGGGEVYGFSPWSSNVSNCYYLFGKEDGGGRQVRYGALNQSLSGLDGSAWTAPTLARTHAYAMPAGSVYPFPMLSTVDHHGDWPLPGSSGQTIGVFRYTYDKAMGIITITAGSLTCTVENGNKCNVELQDPKFLQSVRFPVEPARAGALKAEGYGVFWSYGFSDFVTDGSKYFKFDNMLQTVVGDTSRDLGITGGYYFVPMETGGEPVLRFHHNDGGNDFNWAMAFVYDSAGDCFGIEAFSGWEAGW